MSGLMEIGSLNYWIWWWWAKGEGGLLVYVRNLLPRFEGSGS